MNYTDKQLKRALAKMSPDQVQIYGSNLHWNGKPGDKAGAYYLSIRVLDTELLHLCWLVEETLTMGQRLDYLNYLDNRTDDDWLTCHATWQQRVIALAKVKGVEIV